MKNLLFFALFVVYAVVPVSCLTTLQPLVTSVNIIQDNRIRGNWQSAKGDIAIETMPNTKMMDQGDNHMTNTSTFGHHSKLDGQFAGDTDVNDSILFSKTYSVSFKSNHYTHWMAGSLTRVGNNLFMQLTPIAIDDRFVDGTGYEYTFDYVSTFSIAKIDFEKNSMTIKFLNGDYIKEMIRLGKIRIKHENDVLFGSFLITASTDELKQFLEKYGDDDRLYSNQTSLTLTRKG